MLVQGAAAGESGEVPHVITLQKVICRGLPSFQVLLSRQRGTRPDIMPQLMTTADPVLTPPASCRPPGWVIGLLLAICGFLLFFRLGHYPLWDDEACTAILAKGVWLTGDSLAVHGQNVMAYGHGQTVFGVNDRLQPPLQLYLMAPFLGLLGDTSFAARLPMALVGLALVGFLLYWLKASGATTRQWVIFSTLLVTNVALWLYLRNARYYAPATLALTIAAFQYLHLPQRPTPRQMLPLALTLGLVPLISTQVFATFLPAFLVDYIFFGRHRSKYSLSVWVTLIGPSLLTTLFILATWNPLVISTSSSYVSAWWHRPMMIWWAFRDLNNGEMVIGSLMLLAPLLAVWRRQSLLLRGVLAAVVICIADGLLDPQTPLSTDYAQIRHLVPIIPLGIGIAMAVIDMIWGWKRWLGVAVLLAASFTNALHWGAIQIGIRLRSTQYMWAKELIRPIPDPYSVAIQWVKETVPPGSTVGIDPAYMRYPLMFHAPQAVYSWQLDQKYRSRLPNLEPRQFKGVEAPDYFIGFGYRDDSDRQQIENQFGFKYQQIHTVRLYWRDLYRPEIVMRHFTGEQMNNPYTESIFFFRRPSGETTTQPSGN